MPTFIVTGIIIGRCLENDTKFDYINSHLYIFGVITIYGIITPIVSNLVNLLLTIVKKQKNKKQKQKQGDHDDAREITAV